MEEKFVIITAGGVGKRMDSELPKQLLEIGGKPILRWTIEHFLSLPFEVKVIVVMNKEYVDFWKEYCLKTNFVFPHILAKGGLTRFHSVKEGIKYVKKESLVAVHDGVRPFVSNELITSLYEVAKKEGAAIPFMKMTDSMRVLDENGILKRVDRDKYVSIQTPQIFKGEVLINSYRQAFDTSFTDDASVVEKAGYPLSFVKGERENIKITVPSDIPLAEAILKCCNL